ncbi:hypothetical protein Javan173_0022 [Streptococcus phage Javan173]|uniref:minor capsid protein n=1 Tax=Streptococcus entericus TaxID=155680 RepID=UPI00035C17D7|nr:minor capsid protein [Streptococcus entericus]QBX15151.1 hypothetical protein Javan173_0022 [Streptococcus phage Javan173]
MKHNDYWVNRSKAILAHVDRTDIDIFAEIQKLYASEAVEMQKELFAFVTRYADNNAMSYQEALQRLRGQDLSDYQANAQKYREQAEKDPELLKRLNEQYAASKVTRMEALNLELVYKIGTMNGVLRKSFEDYLKSTANYVYQKALGGHAGALNEPALQELIRTPFNGADYSEQLWGNTDKLVEDVKDILKRGFVRGDDVRAMAQELATKYNVARSRAQTLIRTDGTSIINRATIRRYQDAGLKYYRILVQLDGRTTQICRNIAKDDKRYHLDELQVGVTAPPFHFNCRSTVIPDEEELERDKKFGIDNDLNSVNDNVIIEPEKYLQHQFSYYEQGVPKFIPTNTIFEATKAIAGFGADKELRIADKLVQMYGGESKEWTKMVGKIESNQYIFDMHWYENKNDGLQKDIKLKFRKEK